VEGVGSLIAMPLSLGWRQPLRVARQQLREVVTPLVVSATEQYQLRFVILLYPLVMQDAFYKGVLWIMGNSDHVVRRFPDIRKYFDSMKPYHDVLLQMPRASASRRSPMSYAPHMRGRHPPTSRPSFVARAAPLSARHGRMSDAWRYACGSG
jgi:hypothetical protein